MPPFTIILLAVTVGAAAGYVGAFMILRRMALVGDALTHVALPGVGLALTFGINPLLGGFAFLAAAVSGIWVLQIKTQLYTEALVGLFFTAALAAGILVTPEHELMDALFGDITESTPLGAFVTAIVSALVVFFLYRISKTLLLATIAPELAKASRLRFERTELLFLFLVSVVVALGIGAVGTLLMGPLVIIPAITAKNTSGSFRRYATVSAAVGALSAGIGVAIAHRTGAPPGAAVVLVATALFVFSLAFRQRR